MIKDKAWFPVAYMFVITAAFSSVLIGFAQLTDTRVEANRQLAFERAVLEVFSLHQAKTPLEMHQTFTQKIQGPDPQLAGAYTYMEDGRLQGYALPLEGQGFWAPIKGVLGIAPDKKTILAITFYQQSETPGLGAEIVKPDFCNQFHNKTVAFKGRPMEILPAGTALEDNQVHAVTGATQTCTRLEKLMNETLAAWIETMNHR